MRLSTKSMFPVAVLAQVLGSGAVHGESVEEVSITAYRTPVLESEIIGNHAAVDGDTLDLRAPTHIQQALARVPGVNFQHNSGQEYLPAIRSPALTGAGACGSFLMAEDGIPLRPAGFCNINELFEAHSEQASRIEVMRGPGVALYGSNALHGVVNVITAEPGTVPGQLSVEYGSEDYYRLGVNAATDTTSLQFTGTRDGGFRDDSGVDQQKLTLRDSRELGGIAVQSGATLINLNQETAGYISGYKAYEDSDLASSNPNPEAYRDARAIRLWTRLSDQAAQPSWSITPYARHSEMDFLMHFLPGTPLEENGQSSVGVQTALYRNSDRGRLILGVDGEVVDGWLKQYQLAPTQGSPFLQATIPEGFHYDYSVTGVQVAPFVHWDYQLAERWRLAAGLRYEWMRYDYDNRMIDGRTRDDGTACGFGGCRYSRPGDGVDNFHNLSPKLGLSYSPDDNHRIHLTVASGFRAPQAVELYRLQQDQQLADLDSERLDSVELGFQGSNGALDYQLLAYAMKKTNVIYRDSAQFNVDSGKTRHDGVELSLAYELSDSLSLRLAFTEARHRYDYDDIQAGVNIDGNDLDGAPRRFGNGVLQWSPSDRATVELEWLHMGKYYTNPENLNSYEGHDIFNLLGSLWLNPRLKLNLRVTNLGDEDYAERADFTTFSGDRYFPGQPRSLFVGATWLW